ncbi:MAG: 4-(cytidine 5'-diphospho)-2-C-methyl-D-erythritol kinase [Omnitrophica bacterium RBG_13_46_9]|nr:MAG: 4-(cytidine 5'-diphospho)-2-C-methyl-D-erythritol kinase [Omnitrophica bacterium RBG_13_46_9]
MILYAPAKVNLYLRILGKRSDGYHDIETIFERIALFDKIVLSSLKGSGPGERGIKIFSDHPDVPVDKDGLVYKTVDMLKRRFNISKGIEVRIFKRIPVASGLGGGSSDAAAILTGLNKLWKLSLSSAELIEFGKTLGADIPFFLSGSSFALAEGRGDKIVPLDWKMRWWHLLVYVPIRLFSKDIYEMYSKNVASDLTREPQITKILPLDAAAKSDRDKGSLARPGKAERLFPNPAKVTFGNVTNFIKNDLEEVVLKKEPIVAKLKKTLEKIGLAHSLVSGSGPSIFILFEKRKEAMAGKELLIRRFPVVKREGWEIFMVPTA